MNVKYDMKVNSVTKIVTDKEEGEEIVYKLVAKDKNGHGVSLSGPEQFSVGPGSVILVSVVNSQKSMEEFKEVK